MNDSKTAQMRQLITEIRNHRECERIFATRKGKPTNLGLINQFNRHETIPNKWFDWERRINADIMIIGQDWGPYSALKKYIEDYESFRDSTDFDYTKFLLKTFSSRTEKFIAKALETTYRQKHKSEMPVDIWNDTFFTVSVLFTRQGKHFRGNDNFDPQKSLLDSLPFVMRQIEIVKPKTIVTLGGMALYPVSQYFKLGLENEKITDVINSLGEKGFLRAGSTRIIPAFHPAAHIDPNIQMKSWEKIWEDES